MTTPSIAIKRPQSFTRQHEQRILQYLTQGRHSLSWSQWQVVFKGFALLHSAQVITEAKQYTFRQIYNEQVDTVFANSYIGDLFQLADVLAQHAPLRAKYARQIVKTLREKQYHQTNVPSTNLLLTYCLYFWESFAKGYAFEVEIYRDLTASGVNYQAHDIRTRSGRLTPYDLQVLNLAGDIKTSTYFLQAERGRHLPYDFYVTRLYGDQRLWTLVVMLQMPAWQEIDGDTIQTVLTKAIQHFPTPVQVEINGYPIVVAEYNIWKQKLLKKQRGSS